MLKKVELADIENNGELEQLLSEYWQPFAVTVSIVSYIIWLRKTAGHRVRSHQ